MRSTVLACLLAAAGPAACAQESAETPKRGSATQPTTQAGADKPKPLEWHRPRFKDRQDERRRMVAGQMSPYGAPAVTDARTLQAMRDVPRHLFVPDTIAPRAYADSPQPIGYGQTISQPYIVALMTELLGVKPGDKVLEVGTGSGYQAAVLGELTPHVYTIEIVEPLGRQAAERLKRLEYKTIQTRIGDGYYGWKEHAPFDAIIVTCAATREPPSLLRQLKPGGRLCIPVGQNWGYQSLRLVEKTPDGTFRRKIVLGVRFVPLTGGHD